ncbi:MAG: hypothetical protein KJ957_01815 [Candidatus Omnitrophica bacterium]|nr:hypothetical protein [Candidatus Omnitrophota bacterium]
MSIINDAIKKARKESVINNEKLPPIIVKEEKTSAVSPKPSEIRWTVIVIASLVFIISLLGSIVLYSYISKINIASSPSIRDKKDFFSKDYLSSIEFERVLELNGIVYGPEEQWAIINNRIVRQGDPLLDGKLTLIAKDFVRIEKDNGEEFTLDLR